MIFHRYQIFWERFFRNRQLAARAMRGKDRRMANQEIAVNTDTLASDIAELNGALDTARKMLSDMFTQIQELDAMWDGPANDEFNRQFANDHENAEEMCKTVQSLIECMEYAKEQYNSCENQVNVIVSAINI